jgi:hypothetical protein
MEVVSGEILIRISLKSLEWIRKAFEKLYGSDRQ